MDDFPKPKTVCFVLFDGVQILDVSGPAEVLSQANTITGKKIYDIIYVSSSPTGQVMTSSGIRFVTDPLPQLEQLDVIVLPGGYDVLINEDTEDKKLMDWLQTTVKKTDLKISICLGAFILGELGLLSNKKVTTHWQGISTLKERFSDANVMNDILHIKDKDVWSSAAILTGIDMMLAMVKKDINNAVALEIARILGIYLFREGNQPQISAAINFQSKIQDASLLTLISWLENRLDAQITIEEMANFSAMSVRSLHRKCQTTFQRQ